MEKEPVEFKLIHLAQLTASAVLRTGDLHAPFYFGHIPACHDFGFVVVPIQIPKLVFGDILLPADFRVLLLAYCPSVQLLTLYSST